MSRIYSSFLLISAFLFTGSSAHSESNGHCPATPGDLIRSLLFYQDEHVHYQAFYPKGSKEEVLRYPRSQWGRSESVKEVNQPYPTQEFWHRHKPIITIYKDSLAEAEPELTKILDDIQHFLVGPNKFAEAQVLHSGTVTSVVEMKKFFYSRLNLYEDGFNRFCDLLSELDPQIAGFWRQKLEKDVNAFRKSLKKSIDPDQYLVSADDSEKFKQFLDVQRTQMEAQLTEAYAAVALPKVKDYSLRLTEFPAVKEALEKRMNILREGVARNPRYLADLERRFPNLMDNAKYRRFKYINNPDEGIKGRNQVLLSQDHPLNEVSVEDVLRSMEDWFSKKEVDVLRNQDDKLQWVEVKMMEERMTLRHFTRGFGPSTKSPMRQLEEDRELLSFLGLEDKFQLEFYCNAGVTPEVEAELKKLGIRYIPPETNLNQIH